MVEVLVKDSAVGRRCPLRLAADGPLIRMRQIFGDSVIQRRALSASVVRNSAWVSSGNASDNLRMTTPFRSTAATC